MHVYVFLFILLQYKRKILRVTLDFSVLICETEVTVYLSRYFTVFLSEIFCRFTGFLPLNNDVLNCLNFQV